jgi:sulfur carrier protein ThiS
MNIQTQKLKEIFSSIETTTPVTFYYNGVAVNVNDIIYTKRWDDNASVSGYRLDVNIISEIIS